MKDPAIREKWAKRVERWRDSGLSATEFAAASDQRAIAHVVALATLEELPASSKGTSSTAFGDSLGGDHEGHDTAGAHLRRDDATGGHRCARSDPSVDDPHLRPDGLR